MLTTDNLTPLFSPGAIMEWGVPNGQCGRLLPLQILNHNHYPLLWAYNPVQEQVAPPRFVALGLCLEKTYFIKSTLPLKELRPVFLEPTFRCIILDSPLKLKVSDFSFLAAKARQHQQIFIIFRPYFLSPKRGNPFCRTRINCTSANLGESFIIQFIKGGPPQKQVLRTHPPHQRPQNSAHQVLKIPKIRGSL